LRGNERGRGLYPRGSSPTVREGLKVETKKPSLTVGLLPPYWRAAANELL